MKNILNTYAYTDNIWASSPANSSEDNVRAAVPYPLYSCVILRFPDINDNLGAVDTITQERASDDILGSKGSHACQCEIVAEP